jgi:phenylpropionate dioxygenase-like ring-hydroxylating dioxygenase large terminal subunit
MSREQLIEMARENLAYVKAGATQLQPDVLRVPASNYFDRERWQLEIERIFRRMPLMLAFSCELTEPGSYKSMVAADVPLFIVRGRDGEARAFMNSCAHRGAQVVPEGSGKARRFMCPYHAWTYDEKGALVGILDEDEFGEIDRDCHGLTALPISERAGLIWVGLRADSPVDFDAFLAGYDEVLAHFGFEGWHLVSRREVAGPNWKIAYDGYLDLYHLPILHKDTFGPKMPHQALYHAWGPHQAVSAASPNLAKLDETPEDQWPDEVLLAGVWTIFPHVSIASFDAGGRGVLISQLFPGETPLTSVTVQSYLMENEPNEAELEEARKQIELL